MINPIIPTLGKCRYCLYIIALVVFNAMSIQVKADTYSTTVAACDFHKPTQFQVQDVDNGLSQHKHQLININELQAGVADNLVAITEVSIILFFVIALSILFTIMHRRYLLLYQRSCKIAIRAKNLKTQDRLFKISLNSFNAFTWNYDFRTMIISYDDFESFPIDVSTIDTFKKVFQFTHPDDMKSFEQVVSQLVDGRINQFNYVFRSDFLFKGRYEWWEVRGMKEIRYDEIGKMYNVFCGIIINVNDHKVTEKHLSMKAKSSEDSVRFKEEFLTAVSHELQIPLNVIIEFSQAIIDAKTPEEMRRYNEILKNNGEVLKSLIYEISDISRIETGRMRFHNTHFDFVDIFNDIFLSLDKSIHKTVNFNLISPYQSCYIDCDKYRITQIINNLVANAINITKKGCITMGYKCIDNGIKIEVTDTSIGMTAEEKKKAFTMRENGDGLGLHICKTIVKCLNGQIGVDSEVGKGSTFWVWLPCNPIFTYPELSSDIIESVDTVTPDDSLSIFGKKLRILVADDVVDNYEIIKLYMSGHSVSHAINGADALQLAGINKYDIILMDIKMPVLDGIEAIECIRKLDLNTPIIAVSAHAYDVDREAALNAGCNAFITKPFTRSTLISQIKKFI